MALNIDLDGFGFLDSDSDGPNSKLSPTLNKPPVSPIESESSGISSLDSDDLKKQLSSPPTISISQDDDQSNDFGDKDDEEEDEEEEGKKEEQQQDSAGSSSSDDASEEMIEVIEEVVVAEIQVLPNIPVEVIYQKRNVLNLAANVWNSGRFIQYTVLPKNNLSCFFQNRAQYFRLGEPNCGDRPDSIEKCSCCDFSYPSILNPPTTNHQNHHHHHINQNGQKIMAKNNYNNAITDSLLTFLKNHHVDYNNPTVTQQPCSQMPNNINHTKQPSQRMYNNSAPYAAYQIIQQQYQNNNNGYNNGFNSSASVPPTNGYYGNNSNATVAPNNATTLNAALLNLMSQSRNVPQAATGAFQAMNNNSRYYNNNMNNNNNNTGYGLYKQF